MGFVQSAGAVRGLSGRPAFSTPSQRITLSSTMAVEYGEIWRTQESVRTVVTFLARNIAQLGLPVYRRKGDADRERLQDHPLSVLLRRPNPWTTRYRLINGLVHDFAIYDVAYWWKTKTADDGFGVMRIPPKMVKPVGDNWFTPEAFEITGTKQRRVVPAGEIVYFRGYGLDEDTGTSPLEALRRTLREEWTGSEMREQIMRNGARVSGYIERPPKETSGNWSSEARAAFRRQWHTQYTGDRAELAGGTPILEDGMTFKSAAQSAKDLQYIEGRKLTREEVAAAYFIPPPMVGILDKASFSNITEQHKMLYQDTLGPWLTMIQDEIALQLIPEFEPGPKAHDFYVEFNLREKLTGSFEQRGAVLSQAVGAPWLTRNEARAMDNRPPVDGGDELILPLNLTQNGDQHPVPAEDGPPMAPAPTGNDDTAPDTLDDEQED